MIRGEQGREIGEWLVNIAGDIVTGIGCQSGSLVQRMLWAAPLGLVSSHTQPRDDLYSLGQSSAHQQCEW